MDSSIICTMMLVLHFQVMSSGHLKVCWIVAMNTSM